MPREIRLNAFDMNCVGHIQHGLWTHPRDQSGRFNELQYWIDHAKKLEAGLFDGIFLADVVGVYDVYGGNADGALRGAVQVPVNDPTLIIPAMAAVTTHLGFGVTCNLTYEPPFLFARRMSTLDHLTQGRIAWNIVTGYLDSAARAIGIDGQAAHDDRYDLADEYMSLVYKLWEGSWDDDAVLARPRRGHLCRSVEGACDPSPRQAVQGRRDASVARRRRSARRCSIRRARPPAAAASPPPMPNACSSTARRRRRAKAIVDDIRAQAVQLGRAADDVQVFLGATLVLGRTDKEAQEKFEDYRRYASSEAALVHAAASLGIDFAKYDLDEPVDTGKSQAIVSNVEIDDAPRRAAAGRGACSSSRWSLGSRQRAAGSARLASVADALIDWSEETGVDGFNLSRTVVPECIDDVVDLLVPVLQERGALQDRLPEQAPIATSCSAAPRLPASHAAAKYRAEPGS